MSDAAPLCPCCGSSRTASRRHLFHWLLDDAPLLTPFSWYSNRIPGACPPKSLFAVLLLLALGVAIPAVGLWLLGHFLALQWLAVTALLLLAGLLFDVLMTYRRYKAWCGEWLCGECRAVFSLPAA